MNEDKSFEIIQKVYWFNTYFCHSDTKVIYGRFIYNEDDTDQYICRSTQRANENMCHFPLDLCWVFSGCLTSNHVDSSKEQRTENESTNLGFSTPILSLRVIANRCRLSNLSIYSKNEFIRIRIMVTTYGKERDHCWLWMSHHFGIIDSNESTIATVIWKIFNVPKQLKH